jgi:uncharacterized membrane protein
MNKDKKSHSKKTDDDVFWIPPDRIVALTDGVFAITMTLLVLELRAEYLWKSDEWIKFYAYGLGFFSLAVFWILHHYIFHFIKRSTVGLLWLNIIFLAFSSMVPFWTLVINEGPDAPEPYPQYITLFYGLFMIAVMLTLNGLWWFATKNKYLVGRDFDPKIVPAFHKVILVGIIILVVSSVSSALPEPINYLGYLLFAAAVWFLVATIYGPHKIFK